MGKTYKFNKYDDYDIGKKKKFRKKRANKEVRNQRKSKRQIEEYSDADISFQEHQDW
jgi:hypothetical protein